MPWIQISIQTRSEQAAELEQLLEDAGALSVTTVDAEDQPLLEPGPGETPLWDHLVLTGLFEADSDQQQILQTIRTHLNLVNDDCLQVSTLKDQEWTRTWMDHFQPMPFGSRLWVCPDGFEPPDADAVNLRLDPGLAFGTGTHPTTALCLQWLDAQDLQQTRVLDYGCGSGILAIAALLLGADCAFAVDNDPQALTASRDNAIKNHVDKRLDTFMPEDFADQQVDICMANILAGPLTQLAPILAAHTRPGGDIILSGILQEQADEVRQCYQQWFDMDEAIFKEDWTLLHGVKTSL